MENAKIIIVEDEALIAEHIAMCLEDIGHEIVLITGEGEEVLSFLEENGADLVLVDIQLEGALDGVDTAHEIRVKHGIPFVFVTSNADPATLSRARRTEPAGFVVKPYQPADLAANITMALFKTQRQETAETPEKDSGDSFFIKDGPNFIRVHYRDIRYAEALDNYTRLHLKDRKMVLSQTLKSVEARLDGHGFARVHRSFLVNLVHIDLIGPRHLLIGETEIPISDSQRKSLLESIQIF